MNEILKMLNALTADELDSVIMRANIILEKKRKEEAEQALIEKERLRQEKIAQEKKRQQEIAELQRKLQELQSQSAAAAEDVGEVKGSSFVMYNSAPEKSAAPQTVSCPHCGQINPAGSVFCSDCGQKMTSATAHAAESRPASAPASKTVSQPIQPQTVSCPHCGQINPAGSVFCSDCGQMMTSATVHAAESRPASAPAPAAAPSPAPSATLPQVRYISTDMKKWEMLPGETPKSIRHEIRFIEPAMDNNYKYLLEVTDQRILVSRMSQAAASVGVAFGLIGTLARNAAGAGPKPWLEIPLAAIKNCGLRAKKEFFFEADKVYVIKNHGFDGYVPKLVAEARQRAGL